MKLLIISPRVYPANYISSGNNYPDHTRAIDIIKHLKIKNKDKITLSIMESPLKKFNISKKIKIHKIKRQFKKPNYIISKLLNKLGMAIPDFYSSLYTFSPKFLSDLKQEIDKNDTIYLTTSTAIFINLYARLKNKYIITDPFGSFFQLSLRNIYSTKYYLLPVWFIRLCIAYIIEFISSHLSNKVIVFNKIHQEYFKKLYFLSDKKFHYLPIKMVVANNNTGKTEEYRKKFKISKKDKIILFIGNFTIPQNLVPLQELLVKINKLPPRYKLLIVGATHSDIQNSKKVILAGFIHDLENIIPLSSICLAHTKQGSGVKTKILLYLLFQKPVLTTIQGANFLPKLDNIYIGELKNQINTKYLSKINNKKHFDGYNFVMSKFTTKTFTKQLNLLFNNKFNIVF